MSDLRLADHAMMMCIALHQIDWQSFFDPGSLERGRRYAKQGRVVGGLGLEFDVDRLVLTAQVMGSRKQAYQTEVAVYADGSDDELFTDCSCPVGVGCKHAVALIHTFLDEMSERPAALADGMSTQSAVAESAGASESREKLVRSWEAWLAQLENSPGLVQDGERIGDEYRLGLFLDTTTRYAVEPVLKVLPVWLRPSRQRKRSSGWVSPRVIETRGAGELVPAPKAGWNPEQEEAVDLLLHGEVDTLWGSDHRLWAMVSHAFQARALWSLLDSDAPPLLFFRKQTGQQLESGPGCRLAPSWQPDARGVQHLQADTYPEGLLSEQAIMARAGRELCYLDPSAAASDAWRVIPSCWRGCAGHRRCHLR